MSGEAETAHKIVEAMSEDAETIPQGHEYCRLHPWAVMPCYWCSFWGLTPDACPEEGA
jgi:hypothetical protein